MQTEKGKTPRSPLLPPGTKMQVVCLRFFRLLRLPLVSWIEYSLTTGNEIMWKNGIITEYKRFSVLNIYRQLCIFNLLIKLSANDVLSNIICLWKHSYKFLQRSIKFKASPECYFALKISFVRRNGYNMHRRALKIDSFLPSFHHKSGHGWAWLICCFDHFSVHPGDLSHFFFLMPFFLFLSFSGVIQDLEIIIIL